jgi:hypothetical protein
LRNFGVAALHPLTCAINARARTGPMLNEASAARARKGLFVTTKCQR